MTDPGAPSQPSLNQIIAPILDTSHTLQSTLQSANVTMPPAHFFQHLSLSMAYLNMVRTRLRKNRDLMRQKRCFPIRWGRLATRQEMGRDGEMHEVQILQENSHMQLVEMLSVFRMKGLNEDVPALYWRQQNSAQEESKNVIGLTPDELVLLQSGGTAAADGSLSMPTTTQSTTATTTQRNPIENSKKRIQHIQQEIDDQFDEFSIPPEYADSQMDNEYLDEYKEQADDLMRNVIEDEHHLPQIEAFFEQQEQRIQMDSVSILDRNVAEGMVEDPLSPEQRQALKKKIKEQLFAQKQQLQSSIGRKKHSSKRSKKSPDSQEDLLTRNVYSTTIFDSIKHDNE
mmetsp:Transcript_9604/g.35600  ORF Transcript_9604/g.35600 Transcript_9604/m.35600 type:complete len:342 (-) Transcript_9604:67-1092(-)|eukprot:CAMPEP_0117438056 /NCGR_PEP_ID=MMETSP0759-20121206/1853_1 /TAXON_ID=63605 /ORGANISM="Percolomonas cosmopolitus, Strain WS" /LENGTH=341 /DNA_ID=CAMNT_0005229729 /DNA_START=1622 /DNA_END=2644 /DNA_ORIENTATION=+